MISINRYFQDCSIQNDISRREFFQIFCKNKVVEWIGTVVAMRPTALEIAFDKECITKKKPQLFLHILPGRLQKSRHIIQLGKELKFRAKLLSHGLFSYLFFILLLFILVCFLPLFIYIFLIK